MLTCPPARLRPTPLPPPCSGPYGLQPKGSHAFNFTTLDASGQPASVAGHECWLEAVPAGGGGGGAADYKPCSSPVELAGDIKVGPGRSLAAAGWAAGAYPHTGPGRRRSTSAC